MRGTSGMGTMSEIEHELLIAALPLTAAGQRATAAAAAATEPLGSWPRWRVSRRARRLPPVSAASPSPPTAPTASSAAPPPAGTRKRGSWLSKVFRVLPSAAARAGEYVAQRH